jgi:cupin fold WbuC family metalloprotein
MGTLRPLDDEVLARTIAGSRSAPRRRCNHNLHPRLDDPVQRFLNVVQPESYVRPHRHAPERFELFLILAGRAAAILFDERGEVREMVELATVSTRAVEIPGGTWHTVVALAPDTVLFEVKPGPYAPISDKDFAAWAAPEGTPEAARQLAAWRHLVAADRG